MNVDGFNPGGNLHGGRSAGVTAIYMVCLNLPPPLRYKVENVYVVGIIPGPSNPSKAQINRILEHLVNDLCNFWDPGVLIPTPKYPKRRIIRCALLPLVCDLPASNDVAGFRHHAATFPCPYCLISQSEFGEVDTAFQPRLPSIHRQSAASWKNAETEAEMEKLEKRDGARWSELLRLSYWNPITFKVLDPMHMFSALYERHCRKVFGMSATAPDGDGDTQRPQKIRDPKKRAEYAAAIQKGDRVLLSDLSMPVLRSLCAERGLPWGGRAKAPLVSALLNSVSGS